jgi:hypothetical protein
MTVMRPLLKPGAGVDRSGLAFFLGWQLCETRGGTVDWLVIRSERR